MDDTPAPALDPRKIRIGLVIVSLTVVAAVVLFLVVDAPVVKALMLAVAALGFVLAFLLTRSLRSTA